MSHHTGVGRTTIFGRKYIQRNNGSVVSGINFFHIYFHLKMVVRPKHVAAKLNKTTVIAFRRRKPTTLISYTQHDPNTQD
jgi:hypothetical protein